MADHLQINPFRTGLKTYSSRFNEAIEEELRRFPDPVFSYIYQGNFYYCMVQFTAIIQQFAEKGEKTGWSYITIPPDIAEQLKPGFKKSFRVKGKLDSIIPLPNRPCFLWVMDVFILPLNASLRKAIHKNKGAMLKLILEEDKKPLKVSC